MTARPLAGTALLCLVVFASTVCVGAFGPLLPEIARAQRLPDWELGVLAGSFGFARIVDGGAPELLSRLAQTYIGPGTVIPNFPNPPAGWVTRITVDRITGSGPPVSSE